MDQEQQEIASWPPAPIYNWDSPRIVAQVSAKDINSDVAGFFFRTALWTPDATCILTTGEDRVIRVFDVTYEEDIPRISKHRSFSQTDAVNGAIWYPSATKTVPETLCIVTSTRDTPVHLIDGVDGRLRASYPIIDHRERFISPASLAFNPDASKLYCGFENAIEVFDVLNPGEGERVKTTFTRRERSGQKGVVSAIAFSPHHRGTYAAGTFSSSVCLYDEDSTGVLTHLEGIEGGGVTKLAFHPLKPDILFVASRRSQAIQVYDLRDATAPVARLLRPAGTNQRLSFDVDPWGRWIASGDEIGTVRVWDAATFELLFEKQLHQDAIGAVQFHPFKPLLLTCSGSRTYLQDQLDDLSDSDSDEDTGTLHLNSGPKDARIVIWSFQESAVV